MSLPHHICGNGGGENLTDTAKLASGLAGHWHFNINDGGPRRETHSDIISMFIMFKGIYRSDQRFYIRAI